MNRLTLYVEILKIQPVRLLFETYSWKSTWKQALEICRYVNQMMEELVDIDAMEADSDEDMRFWQN